MKLLVATDFSPQTDKVLRVARRLASALSAELCVLHVAAPEPAFKTYGAGERQDRDETAAENREEHRLVREAAQSMRDAGIDAVGIMLQGPPAKVILEEADKLDADLIVMGSHGFGAVFKLLLGSVSSAVMKKSGRPVLIVPAQRDDD
ncbi:MAG: universal stress protein [Chromatiales bacterium]|jgi:nucleotide-binding universal stress UspA family protein|nr:universal stress protein [Chromatiales bacterium]